mgnify:CR=1 FL=1
MVATPPPHSGGFVYALYSDIMNRHAPDASSVIHKVGFTTRDISIRIKELQRGMLPGIVKPLLLIWVDRDVRRCERFVHERLKEYNVTGGGGAKENFECSLSVIYDVFNSYPPHKEWHINHLFGKSGPDQPVERNTRRRDGNTQGDNRNALSGGPVDVNRGHDFGSMASYLGATEGTHMPTDQFEHNLRNVLKNDICVRTQGGDKTRVRGRSVEYTRKTVGSIRTSRSIPKGILGLLGSEGIRLSPDCVIRATSVQDLWENIDNLHAIARRHRKLDKTRGWLILHSLKYLIKKRVSTTATTTTTTIV